MPRKLETAAGMMRAECFRFAALAEIESWATISADALDGLAREATAERECRIVDYFGDAKIFRDLADALQPFLKKEG